MAPACSTVIILHFVVFSQSPECLHRPLARGVPLAADLAAELAPVPLMHCNMDNKPNVMLADVEDQVAEPVGCVVGVGSRCVDGPRVGRDGGPHAMARALPIGAELLRGLERGNVDLAVENHAVERRHGAGW